MRTARVAVRPLFALMGVLAMLGQFTLTSPAEAAGIGSGSGDSAAFTDAYNRNGGSAAIGNPTNDVHPWGPGCNQDYVGGRFAVSAIMQRSCAGSAYAVVGEHWRWMVDHYGSNASNMVGYPYNDGHRWGNSWAQDFDDGAIGWNILIRPDSVGRVVQLRGAILRKYLAMGALNSYLGYPVSDEYAWSGEQRQDYQGGSIIWNASEGARASHHYGQGSIIAATSGDPKAYVISGGRSFWLLTSETANVCWGGWNKLKMVPYEEMRAIYKLYPGGGSNVCYPDGTMIAGAGDPAVYVVTGGRLRWVPDGTTVNCLGGWGRIRSIGSFELSIAKSVYPYAGNATCPVASTRESRAADWAKSQIGQTHFGDRQWSGWCELFVENAYGTSGRHYSAAANYTARKNANQINTDQNPPAGAIVFYSWGSYGHVGISIGDGQVVSTQGDGSKALPVKQHAVNGMGLPYLGWAWPEANWPGR